MEVQEVKNIVSTARDLLVGKVPLPVDQCQEITRALIYKFLSAEDATSVALGGEPRYFTGERSECRWDALMSPEQTANEVDRRYRDGMAMLGQADVMPAIRTIYQDAYIPYNDPIILRDFLRAIDRFDTDDTEKIGDAYEMLLQDLGAQASAGQFRTPRHIIDFIVSVIDPQKHETILDPACGTGGFLASAWEHVNRAGRLSAADRGNLARNLAGYDISPTMAMLSTVNLFLHHQQQPVVSVYDTLTSEERWNDHYDVILANPPFMSPKGGIRPHGRFFSNSRRSEVLFVDYIMGHLNESGRAGVIVPEGVIFQSQRAHTQLRRLLVETALAAVVSLPAGVFQPYSGVKTSILILDKTLARRADAIAFFKVENDGYDLGAQRRPIDRNDLPAVQAELCEYLRRLRAGESLEDFTPQTGLVVAKDRIAEGGDYNLSGERYRENGPAYSKFDMVALGDVCEVRKGTAITRKELTEGPIPVIAGGRVPSAFHNQHNREGETITVSASGAYAGFVSYFDHPIFASDCSTIKPLTDNVISKFIFHVLKARQSDIYNLQVGMGQPHVYPKNVADFEIPLPPLEVQREIVAEIEGYQRVIDGARAVVDNWRPLIAVDPEWPLVELGSAELFRIESGGTPKSEVKEYWGGGVPWITLVDLPPDDVITEITATERTISEDGLRSSSAKLLPTNSVVVSSRATIGRIGINRIPLATNQGFKNVVIEDKTRAMPEYVALALTKLVPVMQANASGATYKEITKTRFSELRIPLPPLETQQAIVAEIEAEQALVSANRELAQRMEERIAEAVGRVWGGV